MRSITKFATKYTRNEVSEVLSSYFAKQGYVLKTKKGEKVWAKGTGTLTAPQFFKIDMEEEKIVIEAWMPFALFPFVFIGESGLKSNFGVIVKRNMRLVLLDIYHTLKADNAQMEGYVPQPGGKK